MRFRSTVIAFIIASTAITATAQTPEWEQLLADGAAAYDAGEYEESLLLYGKARQIKDHPKLQLQVAILHEKLGECTAAHLLYEGLVASADTPPELRGRATEGAAGLEECKAAASNLAASESGSGDSTSATAEVVAPPPEPTGPKRLPPARKRTGWIMVGAGAAAVVTSGFFATGWFVPGRVAECQGLGGRPVDCSEYEEKFGLSFEEARDQSRRVVQTHSVIVLTLFGTGFVSMAGGTVVLLTGKKHTVAAMVTPGGVGLVGRW